MDIKLNSKLTHKTLGNGKIINIIYNSESRQTYIDVEFESGKIAKFDTYTLTDYFI